MKTISIITPTLNQSDFIKETIESVIQQKGKFEIEYIIVDGGSEDGTIDILKSYEKRLGDNNRISFNWISEEDKGQSHAINKGIKMSTGDILAYINSDDVYEKGAFKNVIDFFKNNKDIGFAYGKCRIINEEGEEIRRLLKIYRTILGMFYSYKKLLAENFIPQPSTFWRRKVVEKCGLFDLDHNLVMDYEYWLRIGKEFDGAFINENLAQFRIYSSSKSGSSYNKQINELYKVAKKHANNEYSLPILLHKLNVIKIIKTYEILDKLNM